jgi:hypothetical protein
MPDPHIGRSQGSSKPTGGITAKRRKPYRASGTGYMVGPRINAYLDEDPLILAVGPLAAWLYICILLYCRRHLSDGLLPREQVARAVDWAGVATWDVPANGLRPVSNEALVARLCDVGLLRETRHGYLVVGYLLSEASMAEESRETARIREVEQARRVRLPPETDDALVYRPGEHLATEWERADPAALRFKRPVRLARRNERAERLVAFIDAVLAIDPTVERKDLRLASNSLARLYRSTESADFLARAYIEARDRKWGDVWLWNNLSLWAVIDRLAAYKRHLEEQADDPIVAEVQAMLADQALDGDGDDTSER